MATILSMASKRFPRNCKLPLVYDFFSGTHRHDDASLCDKPWSTRSADHSLRYNVRRGSRLSLYGCHARDRSCPLRSRSCGPGPSWLTLRRRRLPWESHESQSRLWENHVGRTPQFWQSLGTRRRANIYRTLPRYYSQVGLAGLAIQPGRNPLLNSFVEADEADFTTLHILLRFEMELALVRGAACGFRILP